MIVVITFIESALLLWFFLSFEFYFVLSAILFLVYASYYIDGHEKTGFRTWEGMRRWSYGLGVKYRWGDRKQFEYPADTDKNPSCKDKQYLFVVVGNVTNMGMIGGFGVHGKTFYNTCYLLPDVLFFIFLVRDVLMWTGAVSDKTDILSLLKRGWSVCYAPAGMELRPSIDLETGKQVPDISIFEFAMRNKISVVPVRIADEDKRFFIINGPQRVQEWFKSKIGWPFPFFIFPRWKGQKIAVEVGVPMDPTIQKSAEEFKRLFGVQITRYT